MIVIFADTDKMKKRFFLLFLVLAIAFSFGTVSALEYIHFRHNSQERHEEGRIILEAPEGIALEARDGQLYIIMPRNLIARRNDESPFVPYTKAEMIERLKEEFPPSEGYFYLNTPGHFIVVYTTSRAFANWYGGLLDRLHEQFVLYWRRLGVELHPPEFPLVAVVLSSEERFREHAKQAGVNLFAEQRAYYHKLTNRIVLYDLTGQQALQEGNQRRAGRVDIQRFLDHPRALNNVMTVIHEAVHQVGFNTGMHPRFAPNPVWLYEGLAILHEVPDTRHRSGWSPGPHVNRPRLEQLRRYLGKPHQESPIKKMIQDDDLFRRQETALDNYALAWGVTYFLVRRRPSELAAYLKILQEKTSKSDDIAEIRIEEFESVFGSDWSTFDRDFVNFVNRL